MTRIDRRPAEINTREVPGHREGDLITGKDHKPAIPVSEYIPREHKELSENTAMRVYFCHPPSPWEKGTGENTNYLVGDMLYPVDDFRAVTRRDVTRIARLLHEGPRKTRDFRRPYEAFPELP
jgi:IS30 family transposase